MNTPDESLALLTALVGIDSVNSDLVPGAAGEADVAGFCAAWLSERGYEVEVLGHDPLRPSLIATTAGTGGGNDLLLCGHLDTVGVSGFDGHPFSARIDGNRLYARGAFDMKSGVAAILLAASRAAATPRRGSVTIALVADEEFGSRGAEEVLERLSDLGRTAHGAVIVEPSSLELTVAHRGFAWFELELVGRSAHGSQPELGVDAIAAAVRVIAGLDELRARLEGGQSHPLLGFGTVRVSRIDGGADAATVAARCTLTIERRTLPGQSVDAVEEELRQIAAHVAGDTAGLTFDLRRLVGRSAFSVDEDAAVVRSVATAGLAVLGRPVRRRGEPFWTDAALFSEAGIPSLVFGVDGGGAHSDVEWVDLGSYTALIGILERTIDDFCA